MFSRIALTAVLLAAACGSTHVRSRRPVGNGLATVKVGDCGDPARDGVVSNRPDIEHADRDLNGDTVPEVIIRDLNACLDGDNCHWNVFVATRPKGCLRYAGAVAGSHIEQLDESGEEGFADLRGWWKLADGRRFLLHQYRFQRGAYRLIEVATCAQGRDDRLLCATE